MYYPKLFNNYIKLNLNYVNFPTHLSLSFRNSYNRLPIDKYNIDDTRYRRFANYDVIKITNEFPEFVINHTGKTIYKQNVDDSRNIERQFQLLEFPQDPFVIEYIKYISKLLNFSHNFNKLNIDLHQVRQIVYSETSSSNSPEGIHQDGCDYVVPALVLNRHNIKEGISYIYDKDNNEINKYLLEKYDFTFLNDKELYHYVSPIEYYRSDDFEEYGFRDLLGLDIYIIE